MKFEKYLTQFQECLESVYFSERTIETFRSYVKWLLDSLDEYYPRVTLFEKIQTSSWISRTIWSEYTNEKGHRLSNVTQSLILRIFLLMYQGVHWKKSTSRS